MKRRDVLVGLTAAASALPVVEWSRAWAQEFALKPEPNAELRLLRWTSFLDTEASTTAANVAAFTAATGVKVTIESEAQENIQSKAALAAQIGSGPDIIWTQHSTPHQFPDKLVDITDVATYLGNKYGGWYAVCQDYGKSGDRWICLPIMVNGSLIGYRKSWIKQAGFDTVPTNLEGFLELCKALKGVNHPAGFAFGRALSDGNSWCHWLLWTHGGKVTDEAGNVVLKSKETLEALEYARKLYPHLIEGTLSWNDASNNQAFIAGRLGMTNNSISIYPALKKVNAEAGEDTAFTNFPIGPVGVPTEMQLINPMVIFKHTKFPNAAKALLAFLMEKRQYDQFIQNSVGYVTQALKSYEDNPVWNSDPVVAAFKNVSERARSVAWPAKPSQASATAFAQFLVVDMFSAAVSGSSSPEAAMAAAQTRAETLFRR